MGKKIQKKSRMHMHAQKKTKKWEKNEKKTKQKRALVLCLRV